MDVTEWLQGLGLERYEAVFRDNEIDWHVLPSLTAEDLKDLGVTLVGHRRRLLDAIAALGADALAATATAAFPEAPAPADAERRQLTVMFCDLVGSTALSARLDPEDLREVIGAYHRAVAEIVAGFDGFVAKYMGDGVLVYFGYPRAHEDDAERAVRAGLGVIDIVRTLNVNSAKLQTRVGIATGLVVVGDLIGEGSAQEQSVVGETPNLAARLQTLAEPDAVVIAAATRRLVGDLFDYRDLGAVELKGIAALVTGWQVLRPSVVASRFEALRGSALTRLVGRDEEIDLLLRRWASAKEGDGQIVLISGEAGLGKSRITAALAERLHAEPYLRLRYFCSPYHQDSALFPFVDQLGRAAGFADDDPPGAKLEKLGALLAQAAPPGEDVALLADLLSLPASERHPLPNIGPQRKKDRTLDALIRRLEGLAHQQPVVMVFEDAHWIDPTSRELLDLTVERVRSLPVMLIVTFRPEFQPPWAGHPQVSMLALNRLDRRGRMALAAQIAGGKALPDDVVNQIADRADGVPLFVEELTKSVLESGLLREETDRYVRDGALPPFAIPTTLHASLMARLDRLASVRQVAQIAAVIGREFSYELLHAVSRLPANELQTSLARLVASELVFRRGTPPDAVYSFKHSLVQDVAYATLLRGTRQLLHGRIADAFVAVKPPAAPEIIAHHLQNAGRPDAAIVYWREAGEQAARRAANREAIVHFRRALALLEAQPEMAGRWRSELAILSQLAPALMSVHGWATPEAGEAIERAAAVGRRLESSADLAPSIANLWLYNFAQARLDRANEISTDLFRIAGDLDDPGVLLQAYHCAWPAAWHRGRFAQASEHIEAGLRLYDEKRHAHHRNVYLGHDPAVCALGINASVQVALGFPARVSRLEAETIALARKLEHVPSLAVAFWFVCEAQAGGGDAAGIFAPAQELLRMSEEGGLPQWRAHALIFLGWALARSGDAPEGIAKLHEAIDILSKIGHQVFLPRSLCLLAEALSLAGRHAEGLDAVRRALDVAGDTGAVFCVARLHQTQAELLLHSGFSRETAEASLGNALTVAQQQGAKGYELRAATGLARLWGEQSRRAEARELLAPVYGWFTEGFDTPDLKEAKELLSELS